MSPKSDPSGRARSPSGPPSADNLEAMCLAHGPVSECGHFSAETLFGDWRLTAFIGRGGNGEVYCAEHAMLGTPAAVKVLMREEDRAKARFEREAKLLSSLKSAAFPRFYAYGEANGTAYFAMELLEPGDLPTGDKAIAQFLLKVCDAVAELHTLGYVHRDIKPSNILWRTGTTGVPPVGVGSTGTTGVSPVAVPVLADLGLVKEIPTPNYQTTAPPVGPPPPPSAARARQDTAHPSRWNVAKQRSRPTSTRWASWRIVALAADRRAHGYASSNVPRLPSPRTAIRPSPPLLARFSGDT